MRFHWINSKGPHLFGEHAACSSKPTHQTALMQPSITAPASGQFSQRAVIYPPRYALRSAMGWKSPILRQTNFGSKGGNRSLAAISTKVYCADLPDIGEMGNI